MYTAGDDIGALVADVGSYATRIGFAGEDLPKAYFPTVIGKAHSVNESTVEYHHDFLEYKDNMEISFPVKDGLIHDWDNYEKIWNHSISKYLKVDIKESPILLAEKPYNPPSSRRKICELMFENFEAPAMFISKDAVLECFACGRTSGLVIDTGASGTVISPVFDGWVETRGLNRSLVGGRVLDAYLLKLMTELQQGVVPRPHYRISKSIAPDGQTLVVKSNPDVLHPHPSYDAYMSLELGRDVKETVCKMSDNALNECTSRLNTIPMSVYELPDGTIIDLGIERFKTTELLCDQSLLDLDELTPWLVLYGNKSKSPTSDLTIVPSSQESIPRLIVDSMLRCDEDIQSTLLANLIISGGGSCFEGVTERLKYEVEKITQPIVPSWRVKSIASGQSERPICAWLGGSILGSLGSFHEMWMTKQDYNEFGSSLIDRKCP